jgi:ADP-ribose pyrophosphatase YjhB (NUDIX family)
MGGQKKNNKWLTAAGVLIFRVNDNNLIEYLLVQNKRKEWSPPKGHLNYRESIQKAAIREVCEETSLNEGDDFIMDKKGRSFKTSYLDTSKEIPKQKVSYYFLGKMIRKDSKISYCPKELIGYGWFTKEEAKRKMNYPEMTEMINYFKNL